ncbi:DegT/DnrJ/EryC1/StrS family aminotransferase [Belliella marina]|uniref:DegT/DnrJ/EryC1/StrS family aminotransferase n=1 Tax=Belliella marina TaxID=1644146 RepID=A0ABW4VQ22_9BACT
MKSEIPFLNLKQFPKELKEVLKAKFSEILDKGMFSGSEEVDLFESKLRTLLKSPYVISCSNGTDALELALRALEIGHGDEVLVPALSWVSTAEAVVLVGAKPIYIDTDPSGLIDLTLLDDAVGSKTKAIIPVHLYGKMVCMTQLAKWAKKKGIFIIEDAAQAIGAFENGISAGLFGDIGCFSFYPSKNLGALGEAGALTTKDKELAHKLRTLANHGQKSRDHHLRIGRNARIDTLQAGFLNVMLNYFDLWQAKRKNLAQIYLEHLRDVNWITLPQGTKQANHNLHLFVIQCEERDALKKHLELHGIYTAIHYPTIIPEITPYRSGEEFPESKRISQRILSLPLNPFIGEEEIKKVCDVLKRFA